MADSPWPMPEVSTTIRSKPLILQEASTSGSAAEISVPVSRVASERMKILSDLIAFIRMRSPRSANPLLLIDAQPENDFVGQRGLACAAGAGDTEHRGLDAGGRLQQGLTDTH